MSLALNVLTLPLRGHQLIEASAGTGKTWTIASLYLRLVLGLGSPQDQPLHPRQILVLTFTRAATRELVDRIRSRLVQAHEVFAGRVRPESADAFLQSLLQAVPEGPHRVQALWRLEQAAAAMDDAAVLTIDAWVQRLISEHLLQPGHQGLEQVLESDEGLQAAAVRDYWRQQVYPLDDQAMAAVADVAPDAHSLAKLLGASFGSAAAWPTPPMTLQASIQTLAEQRASELQALKRQWAVWVEEVEGWFESRLQENPRYFHGNRLKGGMKPVRQWCQQIRRWVAGSSAFLEGVNIGSSADRKLRSKLTRAGLMQLHNRATAPAHDQALPAWAGAFEELLDALDRLPNAQPNLVNHAQAWVTNAVQRRKQAQSAYTFADLLQQVTQALGKHQPLAHRVRQQYPVALVDEFQDTSPAQLSLFEQVYADPNAVDQALLFIGDPKQSIYGFRGADIHSYLRVRRRLAHRLHTLSGNRRSVRPLVTALNTWLSHAERACAPADGDPHDAPETAGAFLHGLDVPFLPVEPMGPSERLVCGGQAMPVLCAWTQGQAGVAASGRNRDAARAAGQIAWMLSHPEVGFQRSTADREAHPVRRLRPQDCCVLVRSHTEALAMAQALRDQGLSSVFLSERESVLQSGQAQDILLILQALLEPRSLTCARRVWACETMGLALQQLVHEYTDDALWDARIQRLQDCAQRWEREGVMAALRHFIREEGLVARAHAAPMGERRLTNCLHLAEWLESFSAQHRSPAALVRAYADVLADPSAALQDTPGLRDATLLRLESEADVVQIVTIHKSKGLQYPVVWLPFGVASSADRLAKGQPTGEHRDVPSAQEPAGEDTAESGPAGNTDTADDGAAPQSTPQDALEALREDVRLLYVALTRAVHQVWLGATPRKAHPNRSQNWHLSALGRWVSGARHPRADADVVEDLRGLWAAMQSRCTEEDPEPGPMGWVYLDIVDAEAEAIWPVMPAPGQPGVGPAWPSPSRSAVKLCTNAAPGPASPARPARTVAHPVQRQWRVSSYSALASGAGEHLSAWRELRWDERADTSAAPISTVQALAEAAGPWHAWPSSAAFGQLLHECLELGAEDHFDTRPDSAWSHALRARLDSSAWAELAHDIQAWLHRVVREPLLPSGQALCELQVARAELEFWMPMQPLDTRALDSLLLQHLWPGEPRPALRPQRLEGLLMGFADLVVESQGRLEVLDHKSNRLADGPRGYTTAALKAAVLEHRYDLQAAVYLLSLHRLLRVRLGSAYRPQSHLGSAHFLFLRGIDQPGGHLVSIPADLAWLEPLDALLGPEPTMGKAFAGSTASDREAP
ncbi:MAG: UvrD-helicase domain-containing protein [Betaproteobacteria bacterium]